MEVWQKLQDQKVACADLTDEDFGVLGEYFMGNMKGDAHASTNAMIEGVLGHDGEEQVHVVMGKRFSGCDESAVYTGEGNGSLPMINMMLGVPAGVLSGSDGVERSSPFEFNKKNNFMMNLGFTHFGGLGLVFMIFWWILILAGIVTVIDWLMNRHRGGSHSNGKAALDTLRERYAKGEIDAKEFEERKKHLS
jgi:putative membrane protein